LYSCQLPLWSKTGILPKNRFRSNLKSKLWTKSGTSKFRLKIEMLLKNSNLAQKFNWNIRILAKHRNYSTTSQIENFTKNFTLQSFSKIRFSLKKIDFFALRKLYLKLCLTSGPDAFWSNFFFRKMSKNRDFLSFLFSIFYFTDFCCCRKVLG